MKNTKYFAIITTIVIGVFMSSCCGDTCYFGNIVIKTAEDIQKWDYLTELVGDMYIHDTELTEINGFNNLEQYNEIKIINNDKLVRISGFAGVGYGRKINISNNPNLLEIDGFNGVWRMSGGIWIDSNDSLIAIRGFDRINRLRHPIRETSKLTISNNNNLRYIDGFRALDDGGLLIENNAQLNTIRGFDKVNTSDGIVISNNPNLSSYPPSWSELYLKTRDHQEGDGVVFADSLICVATDSINNN